MCTIIPARKGIVKHKTGKLFKFPKCLSPHYLGQFSARPIGGLEAIQGRYLNF